MPDDSTSRSHPSRHSREHFFIVGEGLFGDPETAPRTAPVDDAPERAQAAAAAAEFRFSRMGPRGKTLPEGLLRKVAKAMTSQDAGGNGTIPAGYTYLGQFVDHDLTFDETTVALGDSISPAALEQGRSPALDLDSLYGAGPADPASAEFYKDDRHLRTGRTVKVGSGVLVAHPEYDLARRGSDIDDPPRRALIPDFRNDENLAVAQTHLAFIRFHNRVVDGLPSGVPVNQRFRRARRLVTLHYQWMLRTDYLPKICDDKVVNDVFRNGRKVFEVGADPMQLPTMPVEFSVAAFRMGHSMIRDRYDWNAAFPSGQGFLFFLFDFSGTSGFLGGGSQALPSNWIADWRRLYRFAKIGREDLKPPAGQFNLARRIDTFLAPDLHNLPDGAFGGKRAGFGRMAADLAFRNLVRARMLKLASGQDMARLLRQKGVPVTTLTKRQILGPGDGADLGELTAAEKDRFAADTPLWFYVLREAELNKGKLTGVGARIVVETFHRAMEGSRNSIVRNPDWRPTLGKGAPDRFTMMDLLTIAYDDRKKVLAPLGDTL
ncbi:peroxidase family protein [Nocardioides sp. GXQ0305]|uniref:peroxidase family protein n=1 Tax=Nocardioides sp. GXQ0305 TaxID=3423912 RepID=UPI003D7D429A